MTQLNKSAYPLGRFYFPFKVDYIAMVILYTGTPGSGKSYHATAQVHNCTKKGLNVIANFNVNLPAKYQHRFYFVPTEKLNVQFLLDFSIKNHVPNKERQTLIMIDEASILFNSRDYSRKDRADWIKFFSQHRKLGYDIILITQQDRSLDRQIRGQIEYNYVHRKLTNFGFKGWVIRFLIHKQFVCVHIWYPVKERVDCEYFSIKKRVADSYDTFSMFDDKPTECSGGSVI